MKPSVCLSRRALLIGAAVAAPFVRNSSALAVTVDGRYGRVAGEPFPIAAVDLRRINPVFLRTEVEYDTAEQPGTIVVDPEHHFLYQVRGGGRATRYGVGVGKQGFSWAGTATINSKQEWPDWYPPKEMLARQPDLRRAMSKLQSGVGMHGGPRNPLGARAMYLWQGNKDTLYRIHGTVEPWSIGHSVSSGCIRMINQDVIQLYSETAVGTKVIVLGSAGAPVARRDGFESDIAAGVVHDPRRLIEHGLY